MSNHLRIIDQRGERKICREHRVAFVGKCSKCVAAAAEKRFEMQRWYERQWGAEARKVAR